jgi:hypothetical protein
VASTVTQGQHQHLETHQDADRGGLGEQQAGPGQRRGAEAFQHAVAAFVPGGDRLSGERGGHHRQSQHAGHHVPEAVVGGQGGRVRETRTQQDQQGYAHGQHDRLTAAGGEHQFHPDLLPDDGAQRGPPGCRGEGSGHRSTFAVRAR